MPICFVRSAQTAISHSQPLSILIPPSFSQSSLLRVKFDVLARQIKRPLSCTELISSSFFLLIYLFRFTIFGGGLSEEKTGHSKSAGSRKSQSLFFFDSPDSDSPAHLLSSFAYIKSPDS